MDLKFFIKGLLIGFCIAAYGLTLISNFLVGQQFWFKSIGGLFLIYLGYITFRSKATDQSVTGVHGGLIPDYFFTVLLTATNPTTILSFVAVFAGLGLGNTNGDYTSATLRVTGVFIGSGLWWLILSTSVSLVKHKTSSNYAIRKMFVKQEFRGAKYKVHRICWISCLDHCKTRSVRIYCKSRVLVDLI